MDYRLYVQFQEQEEGDTFPHDFQFYENFYSVESCNAMTKTSKGGFA